MSRPSETIAENNELLRLNPLSWLVSNDFINPDGSNISSEQHYWELDHLLFQTNPLIGDDDDIQFINAGSDAPDIAIQKFDYLRQLSLMTVEDVKEYEDTWNADFIDGSENIQYAGGSHFQQAIDAQQHSNFMVVHDPEQSGPGHNAIIYLGVNTTNVEKQQQLEEQLNENASGPTNNLLENSYIISIRYQLNISDRIVPIRILCSSNKPHTVYGLDKIISKFDGEAAPNMMRTPISQMTIVSNQLSDNEQPNVKNQSVVNTFKALLQIKQSESVYRSRYQGIMKNLVQDQLPQGFTNNDEDLVDFGDYVAGELESSTFLIPNDNLDPILSLIILNLLILETIVRTKNKYALNYHSEGFGLFLPGAPPPVLPADNEQTPIVVDSPFANMGAEQPEPHQYIDIANKQNLALGIPGVSGGSSDLTELSLKSRCQSSSQEQSPQSRRRRRRRGISVRHPLPIVSDAILTGLLLNSTGIVDSNTMEPYRQPGYVVWKSSVLHRDQPLQYYRDTSAGSSNARVEVFYNIFTRQETNPISSSFDYIVDDSGGR